MFGLAQVSLCVETCLSSAAQSRNTDTRTCICRCCTVSKHMDNKHTEIYNGLYINKGKETGDSLRLRRSILPHYMCSIACDGCSEGDQTFTFASFEMMDSWTVEECRRTGKFVPRYILSCFCLNLANMPSLLFTMERHHLQWQACSTVYERLEDCKGAAVWYSWIESACTCVCVCTGCILADLRALPFCLWSHKGTMTHLFYKKGGTHTHTCTHIHQSAGAKNDNCHPN